jgi:hypothetical protein
MCPLSVLARASVAAMALALGACHAPDAVYAAGMSDAPVPQAGASSSPDQPPAGRWEAFASVVSMKVLADAFPSRGHAPGSLTAHLRGNALAAESIDALRPGEQMPRGAVLVQTHAHRGTGAAVNLYAMVKRETGYFEQGGDWEWVVARADGTLVARGKLESCARCHADAAADHVFPRSGNK